MVATTITCRICIGLAESAERIARLAYFDAVAPELRKAIRDGRHETVTDLLEGLRRSTVRGMRSAAPRLSEHDDTPPPKPKKEG